MTSRVRPAIGAALAGALLLTGCATGTADGAAEDDRVIRFATLPVSDDPTAETPVVELAALLEQETGYKVEITDVPNYSAVIEAIRAGHEDLGIMSAFPTAMAVNTGEVDPLVAWTGSDDPVARCVVLADSPLQSLEDITPDHTVAFADPASSSGYFMPVYMLDRAGLTRDEDYEVLFSGGHDRSQLALKNGQADVSCTAAMFTEMAGQGSPYFPFEEGETRVIGESPSMPVSIAVLGNQKMDESKRAALLEALPVVFAPGNKDALGTYGEAIPEDGEPMMEPGPETFQTLVDIAAVAGVDISDLE
ncbi:phosphate/phosphite/phosphonate ABC transporter substrate-binding protein [Dietzia lutea]|uniref:Phosphate ABC transporter substrate-binding protein n=1 Tax=Dietzia lutea TaxID=546160 RepID=A0A2S1R874_9ACTN|nr:phosphate/phosphite/phosphonate ABC transporter substrate-binding protein [Dietzia lutea]AWH92488.1 phosphate ABC transporter substrate-binding protein [Dietzia lutea]